MKDMIAICREVDKNSGKIAVYPLSVKVTGGALAELSIRARMNPELRYFVTLAEMWDDPEFKERITKTLNLKDVTPRVIATHGRLILEV